MPTCLHVQSRHKDKQTCRYRYRYRPPLQVPTGGKGGGGLGPWEGSLLLVLRVHEFYEMLFQYCPDVIHCFSHPVVVVAGGVVVVCGWMVVSLFVVRLRVVVVVVVRLRVAKCPT